MDEQISMTKIQVSRTAMTLIQYDVGGTCVVRLDRWSKMNGGYGQNMTRTKFESVWLWALSVSCLGLSVSCW